LLQFCEVWHFDKDGQMVSGNGYYDQYTLLTQLGHIQPLAATRFLNEQLQNPIVQADKKLRLWCLIAKGYTDIEIDYRAAKRD